MPKSNTIFWKTKIARNVHRDEITTAHLAALGWNVITIWECEVATESLKQATLDRIEKEMAENMHMRSMQAEKRTKNKAAIQREHEEIMKRQAALEAEIDRLYPLPSKIRQLSKTALSLSDYMEEDS